MIRFGVQQLVTVRDAVSLETSFVSALAEVVRALPAIQDAYFVSGGPSGGRQLSAKTIKARAKGWGYYKFASAPGVTPPSPFGKWTGDTLNHTTGIMGRVRISAGVASISHDLERWWVIASWWDLRAIETALETITERRWQRIFDLKPVEHSLRVAA